MAASRTGTKIYRIGVRVHPESRNQPRAWEESRTHFFSGQVRQPGRAERALRALFRRPLVRPDYDLIEALEVELGLACASSLPNPFAPLDPYSGIGHRASEVAAAITRQRASVPDLVGRR